MITTQPAGNEFKFEPLNFWVNLVALLFVVVGWIVLYRTTIRAQNRALKNECMNEARKALIPAIRDYIDWCSSVIPGVCLSVLQKLQDMHGATPFGVLPGPVEKWLEEWSALLLDKRATSWLERLEEYELVFPETAGVRVQMLHMNREAMDRAHALRTAVTRAPSTVEVIHSQLREELLDLQALGWDLSLHIQNRCFSRIFGGAVPERQPLDPRALRLVMGQNGMLVITSRQSSAA